MKKHIMIFKSVVISLLIVLCSCSCSLAFNNKKSVFYERPTKCPTSHWTYYADAVGMMATGTAGMLLFTERMSIGKDNRELYFPLFMFSGMFLISGYSGLAELWNCESAEAD